MFIKGCAPGPGRPRGVRNRRTPLIDAFNEAGLDVAKVIAEYFLELSVKDRPIFVSEMKEWAPWLFPRLESVALEQVLPEQTPEDSVEAAKKAQDLIRKLEDEAKTKT